MADWDCGGRGLMSHYMRRPICDNFFNQHIVFKFSVHTTDTQTHDSRTYVHTTWDKLSSFYSRWYSSWLLPWLRLTIRISIPTATRPQSQSLLTKMKTRRKTNPARMTKSATARESVAVKHSPIARAFAAAVPSEIALAFVEVPSALFPPPNPSLLTYSGRDYIPRLCWSLRRKIVQGLQGSMFRQSIQRWRRKLCDYGRDTSQEQEVP